VIVLVETIGIVVVKDGTDVLVGTSVVGLKPTGVHDANESSSRNLYNVLTLIFLPRIAA
jgi:hypothetical protein